jgi:ribosomal protein S12 methylthiotransferase accessory factor
VERDSVALWWYNMCLRPAVALLSFGDPYIDSICETYHDARRELWALDITSDNGIPCVAAISRKKDGGCEELCLGFGAHLDPRVAVIRAITEVSQFLPTVAAPHGAEDYPYATAEAKHWFRTATIAEMPYLAPARDVPERASDSYQDNLCNGLALSLSECIERVEKGNIEILVLDQTRGDLDLHVVRVIAPGLRHFWRRLAPGRLYDTPARIGWAKDLLHESAMNPHTIFF